jgi:hypothetical protein
MNLFGPTTHDVVEATRLSEDEKQWEKQRSRRSKRNQTQPMAMPATGPACGRCRFWSPPITRNEAFGSCEIRVVTMERAVGLTRIIEKGTCLGRDPRTGDLELGTGQPVLEAVDWEFQHCGPAWSCRGYVAAGEGQVAA